MTESAPDPAQVKQSGAGDRYDVALAAAFKLLMRSWYASGAYRAEKALGLNRLNVSMMCRGLRAVSVPLMLKLVARGDRELGARIRELEEMKARAIAKVDAKIERARADHAAGMAVIEDRLAKRIKSPERSLVWTNTGYKPIDQVKPHWTKKGTAPAPISQAKQGVRTIRGGKLARRDV